MLLFLSFFVQPFHQAMANEAAAVDDTLPEEVEEQLPNPEPVEEVEDQSDTETEEVFSDELPPESTDIDSDPSDIAAEIVEPEPATDAEPQVEEGEQDIVVDFVASSTDDTGQVSDESGSTTDDEADSDTNVSDETTSTDVVVEEETPTGDVASNDTETSDNLIDDQTIETGVNDLVDSVVKEVVTLTRQMVTEENYFQFSKQSCVAVGDGTYHCTAKERASVDPDSAVYTERDASGDMEIYMRTSKGEVKQITDNDYDDTSPDMDLASMRIVWQRLIDGRYQIISYDIDEQEETQLTFSRTNSMEPKVAKEGITWQAWDGNDWEILYFDGKSTDQITDNDIQDVTPVIEDGYILWSILGGENSEARVYSIESGEMMTISGHEGGAVVNPRFVLVYDTKFENGDVITQGFDPVTGLAAPISAKPAELPNIPEPDPVGEIRALIQNKSTSKDKEVVTVPTSSGGNDLNLASTTASSTVTLDLNNQLDIDNEQAMLSPTSVEQDFELTEFDLVITDQASSTTSTINRAYYDNGTVVVPVQ
ncbi:MAG: hypothetical protein KBC35_00250 [Candidatus Pacebacteria bacterium]|nr:hypothetical protein [Candidatus Paceibacterota bacterium]